MERRNDDLDVKLTGYSEENEEHRKSIERLEKQVLEQRSLLDASRKKEDKIVQEYGKVVDQLKSDIKDLGRTIQDRETALILDKKDSNKRENEA